MNTTILHQFVHAGKVIFKKQLPFSPRTRGVVVIKNIEYTVYSVELVLEEQGCYYRVTVNKKVK
jgi:hypothetical protein